MLEHVNSPGSRRVASCMVPSIKRRDIQGQLLTFFGGLGGLGFRVRMESQMEKTTEHAMRSNVI